MYYVRYDTIIAYTDESLQNLVFINEITLIVRVHLRRIYQFGKTLVTHLSEFIYATLF